MSSGGIPRDADGTWWPRTRQDVITCCMIIAVEYARRYGLVTADDVRARVVIPVGVTPACVGHAFAALRRNGTLVRVGYRPSHRRIAHARPIAVWALAVA